MSQDEKAREALEIFREIIDGALIQLSMNLGVKSLEQNLAALPFDVSKISWKPMERDDKSKWELATDQDNRSNVDYLALRKLYATERKGVSEGMFYWTMDTAVGRQLNKRAKK